MLTGVPKGSAELKIFGQCMSMPFHKNQTCLPVGKNARTPFHSERKNVAMMLRKYILCHMRKTKEQISVCAAPLSFAA